MAAPPPWSRDAIPEYRYWTYAKRPYPGCGCVPGFLFVVLVWFLLTLLLGTVRIY